MKLCLLVAVSFLAWTNCAALECWNKDPQKATKTCTVLKSQEVNVAECKLDTCKANQMCKRATLWSNGVLVSTSLKGCADSSGKGPRCDKASVVNGKTTGTENCYCDTEKCNGASYATVSVMSLVFSLAAFLVAFYR